ncbi:ThuA domain-containing protein [Tundrisphaera lichenicola]|uniref:ThuA domain-containing protein n=1 Tax=Tundrisphaera lichenicola TaxID=2029860 RepID=UPI003EB8346B
MGEPTTRRDFLALSAALTAGVGAIPSEARAAPESPNDSIRVVVWDERQPTQKEAYDNFLGNRIADHLSSEPGLSVESVALDDPDHGLDPSRLDNARVLIWWGHVRQKEITPEVGKAIVERIKAGQLGLIALHSAHWSTPFVEAMNERSRLDARAKWGVGGDEVEITEIPPEPRYLTPKRDARPTPYSTARKLPGGVTKVELHLPICCFPAYRNDGKPSFQKVVSPDHPIARGIPRKFELPRTEMYDEPFHVPDPDEVIFEERWEAGEWFRSGMVWNLGRGKVFYFRPGHETYPIYKESVPSKILANAVRWMGSK